MDNSKYSHIAFISYKREDEKWAKWLQEKLENYKLPISIRNERPDLPERVKPVFRDTTDLSGGSLERAIKEGLRSSKFLIVICSPRAAQSPWVCKEVQEFIDLEREENIIPFIVDGEPHSDNLEKECFPQALRDLSGSREILGININENGRYPALVKIIARMFDLRYDILWDRFQRSERRRRRFVIGVLSLIISLLIGVVITTIWSYNKVSDLNWNLLATESNLIAKESIDLCNQGDNLLAQRLIIEVLPECIAHPSRPCVNKAEYALRYALSKNSGIIYSKIGNLCCANISPDGKLIIGASSSGKIQIWDAETGASLRLYAIEKTFNLHYIGFSNDGTKIIAADDLSLLSWDVDSDADQNNIGDAQNCIKTDRNCSDLQMTGIPLNVRNYKGISPTKIDSNGKIIKCEEREVFEITNPQTLMSLKVLPPEHHTMKTAFLDSQQERIISTYQNGTVAVWDVNTGKEIKRLYGTRDFVSALFSPDGKRIVTSSYNGIIRVWNVETGEILQSLDSHKVGSSFATFSPDGEKIISTSESGTLRVWDLNQEDTVLYGHTTLITSASYRYDGKKIISSSCDTTLRIWDTETRTCVDTLIGHSNYVTNSCFSPDGKLIASSSGDKTIRIWDYESKECIKVFSGHSSCVNSISFSPDGKRLLSTSDDKTARVWDINTGDELFILPTEINIGFNVKSACYSPNGDCMAFATYDVIRLYSSDGKHISDLHGHSSRVNYISFSPDGEKVVSASNDTIKIWDTSTSSMLISLTGHGDNISTAMFSPDGKKIISASWDKTVRIWDAETGEVLKIFEGHSRYALSACFSPGGDEIISIDQEGIHVWTYPDLQELIKQTNEKFSSFRLTDEEREKFFLNQHSPAIALR